MRPPTATRVASLAFISAMAVTTYSFLWIGPWHRPATANFLYLQTVFDLVLVTAAVHVTWDGSQSEFAPLYILVIAVSALLIPPAGVPLTAALGIVLYFADAMLGHGTVPGMPLFLQLAVFAVVALSSGIIAAKLRDVGDQERGARGRAGGVQASRERHAKARGPVRAARRNCAR